MTDWLRGIALLTLAIYFLFDYLDGRRVRDEREELIRLKALEFAHKANMGVLTVLAFLYASHSRVNAQLVILSLIASALYGEIAAKVFYRWRL
jgi:hypothetical protein